MNLGDCDSAQGHIMDSVKSLDARGAEARACSCLLPAHERPPSKRTTLRLARHQTAVNRSSRRYVSASQRHRNTAATAMITNR